MRKTKLFKSLLVVAGLLVGSSAWATPTVIKSYDFDAATDAVTSQTVLASSGTTTISKTACDNLTGDFAGITVQGNSSWHIYHTNSKGELQGKGFYNNNSGGRLLGLLNLKAGDIITITASGGLPTSATNGTYDSENSTAGTNCIYTVTADGNFAVSVVRYNYVHTVTVTRDLADLEAPTYSITGANGVQRQVTLACLTEGASIKWNNVDDKEAAGWTTYSTPFLTSETTLYAYSEKSGSTSDVITVTTGAGTTLTLNAPTISRLGNSVTITSDQSEIVGDPSATIYYTYGEGEPVEYSSAITVAAEATITAYATATGYNNSGNATRVVALFPTDVAKIIDAPENNTYTTGALSGVDEVGANATFQAVMIDGTQWGGEDVYVQSTDFKFRNGGSNKHWYFDNTSNVWLLVKNLKADDIVVVSTDYQASGLTNAIYTEKYSESNNRAYTVTADGNVEIAFKKPDSGTMHYIYGLYVWSSHYVSVTIPSSGYASLACAYGLDFSGVDGLTAYVVNSTTASAVKLTSVNELPANSGVILEGTAGATYSIPVKADAAYTGTNLLSAAVTATDIAANEAYILQGGEFHLVTAASTVPAGKAYLLATHVPAGVRSMTFVFDDETQGVNDVRSEMEGESNSIYNLAGQRVEKTAKGLYIVNGKKVIIK